LVDFELEPQLLPEREQVDSLPGTNQNFVFFAVFMNRRVKTIARKNPHTA
jgi:hypothetical protein